MHLIHRKLVLALPPSLFIVTLDTILACLDSRFLEEFLIRCGALGWGGRVHAYTGHHDDNNKKRQLTKVITRKMTNKQGIVLRSKRIADQNYFGIISRTPVLVGNH